MLDERAIISLLSIPKIGRSLVRRISESVAYHPVGLRELHEALLGLQQAGAKITIPTFDQLEKADQQAQVVLEHAYLSGTEVLAYGQPSFPKRLLTIPDPPVIVYIKGNRSCLNSDDAVAVIGTREPTSYGIRAASRLARIFAEQGLVVVSGLAKGCDAAAHKGCIEGYGRTIAVLAHGLDKIYPAENRPLAEKILSTDGCLVSEYPLGARAQKSYFVERDRLQSGLSDAVAVVETDINGGTMHTVRFSQKQNRVLGCVVHSPYYKSHPKAQGNKKLLEEGIALPLGSPTDIEVFIAHIRKHSTSRGTTSSMVSKPYKVTAVQENLFDEGE